MQMLGWRYSLVVKCLPSVYEVLGSIPGLDSVFLLSPLWL